MKRVLREVIFVFVVVLLSVNADAQLVWRLANPTFSTADPDGAGPATGVATFTLQIRSLAGTFPNVTGMSTGWSWQSANAMLPTGPAPAPTCGTNSVAPPSNVTVAPALAALGFTFNNVNQCSGTGGFVNIPAGGLTFDRRAVGSFDGGSIDLSTTWIDVFTVTLWAKNPINAGSVMINSGSGGTDGVFPTYAVADVDANEIPVNSLTFATPLALTPTLPVQFTRFGAQCSDNGTTITWNTATERNNAYFEVQKSLDGNTWASLGRVNGNSNRSYEFFDKTGGQAVYRVKQVDVNGATAYTTLVRTTCGSQSFMVNLYPVPAKDKLTLVVGSDKAVRTTVRVLDNNGRVVMTTPLAISKGTNNFPLDVAHLPQGQYYIRGGENGLTIDQRFTITR